jgi:hypothetical protein
MGTGEMKCDHRNKKKIARMVNFSQGWKTFKWKVNAFGINKYKGILQILPYLSVVYFICVKSTLQFLFRNKFELSVAFLFKATLVEVVSWDDNLILLFWEFPLLSWLGQGCYLRITSSSVILPTPYLFSRFLAVLRDVYALGLWIAKLHCKVF